MTYKLRFDRAKYLAFEISPDELEEKLGADYLFMLDEPKWADFWKPVNAKFIDFSDKKNITTPPDITLWFTDQLVLSDKAYKLLSSQLKSYGEFLPVKSEGIPYWLFHVTNLAENDTIDEKTSKRNIEEGGYIDVIKLAFNESQVKDMLLFKTEYNGFKNVYCSEGFKDLVEKNCLNGLIFNTDLASIF